MTRLTASEANVENIVAAMEDVGFAIVERLVDPTQLNEMRSELLSLLDDTGPGRNFFEGFKTQRIYALFAKTRTFDGPATHPLVTGVLDRVVGPAQLSAPVAIAIGPGEEEQMLHADDGIYPLPRPHPEVVLNTMWALDDFTEENGATRVVPGSHKWTDRTPDQNTKTVAASMPAGSVMFWGGNLYHGGGANRTDKPRLGVILHYAAGWLRPQENHLLAVPREIVRDLPKPLQEFLGYNIYPPFVGYVDGHHPKRSLEVH